MRYLKALLAAGAVAVSLCTPTRADDKLTLAIGQPGLWDSSFADIGQKIGIFKKHGLELQLFYTSGGGETQQAVIAGSANIGVSPGTLGVFGAFAKGAPIRIIAGSGAGGLFLIAQKESGITSMADLAARKGKGLKIGTMRFNTFELTLYRNLVKNGLSYDDYNIVWFNDVPRRREGELIRRGQAAGLGLYPVTPLYSGSAAACRPDRAGLVVGYASLDAREIRRGVDGLARVLEELADR